MLGTEEKEEGEKVEMESMEKGTIGTMLKKRIQWWREEKNGGEKGTMVERREQWWREGNNGGEKVTMVERIEKCGIEST
jgi:hypothetical protein